MEFWWELKPEESGRGDGEREAAMEDSITGFVDRGGVVVNSSLLVL